MKNQKIVFMAQQANARMPNDSPSRNSPSPGAKFRTQQDDFTVTGLKAQQFEKQARTSMASRLQSQAGQSPSPRQSNQNSPKNPRSPRQRSPDLELSKAQTGRIATDESNAPTGTLKINQREVPEQPGVKMKNFEQIYMNKKNKNTSKSGSRLSQVTSNEPGSRLNKDIAIAPNSQSPSKRQHSRRFAGTKNHSRRQVYEQNGDEGSLNQQQLQNNDDYGINQDQNSRQLGIQNKRSTLATNQNIIQKINGSRIQSSDSQGGYQQLHIPKIEEEGFNPNINTILSPNTSDGFSGVTKGFVVGADGEYKNHSLLGSPVKTDERHIRGLAQQLKQHNYQEPHSSALPVQNINRTLGTSKEGENTTNTLEMRGHTATNPNPGSAEAEFRNIKYGRGAGLIQIGIGSSNMHQRRRNDNSVITQEEVEQNFGNIFPQEPTTAGLHPSQNRSDINKGNIKFDNQRSNSNVQSTSNSPSRMIGKIKVSKKQAPGATVREALTSPSFALFEVTGAKQMMKTAAQVNRRPKNGVLQERGTTANSLEQANNNIPIIATRSMTPFDNQRDASKLVQHLEDQLFDIRKSQDNQSGIPSPKSSMAGVPKIAQINYSQALAAAEALHSLERPNQVKIDKLKKQAKEQLMKYSITQNKTYKQSSVSPRVKAANKSPDQSDATLIKKNAEEVGSNNEDNDTVIAPRSPSYPVDDAIAMTASKFMPKVKLGTDQIQLNKDIKKQTNDAFAGGNSVLSNLRPYGGDIALSSERDYKFTNQKAETAAKASLSGERSNTSEGLKQNERNMQINVAKIQITNMKNANTRIGSNENSLERVGVNVNGEQSQSARRHTLSDEHVVSRIGGSNVIATQRGSTNDYNDNVGGKPVQSQDYTPRTDNDISGEKVSGIAGETTEVISTSQIERQNIKIQEGTQAQSITGVGIKTDENWSVGGDHNQHELHSSLSPHKNEKTTLVADSPYRDQSNRKQNRKNMSNVSRIKAVQPSNVQIQVSPGKAYNETERSSSPTNIIGLTGTSIQQRSPVGPPETALMLNSRPSVYEQRPGNANSSGLSANIGAGSNLAPNYQSNALSIDFQSLEVQLKHQQQQFQAEQSKQEQMYQNIQRLQESLENDQKPRRPSNGSNENASQARKKSKQDTLAIKNRTWESQGSTWYVPSASSRHINPNIIENYLIEKQERKNKKNVSFHGPAQVELHEQVPKTPAQLAAQVQQDYHKAQTKNMNAHHKKQKMPFSHFDHPNIDESLRQNGLPGASQNHKKQGEGFMPSLKLQGGSPIQKNKQSSPIAGWNASISFQDHKTEPQRSFVPAPKQRPAPVESTNNNTREGFQNRLIQKRISADFAPVKQPSLASVERVSTKGANNDLPPGLLETIGKSSTESISKKGMVASTAQVEQQSMKLELRDIELQLSNLQEVYSKNQEVLRQIKVFKVKKYSNPASPPRSRRTNTNRSGNSDPASSQRKTPLRKSSRLARQDSSPRLAKELQEQEQAIQQQQEELQKALLQSQLKNLQIQQKLKQKSDLQSQILDKKFGEKSKSKSPVVFKPIPQNDYSMPISVSNLNLGQYEFDIAKGRVGVQPTPRLSPRPLAAPIIQQLGSPRGSPKSSNNTSPRGADDSKKPKKFNLKLDLSRVQTSQMSQNIAMLRYLYTNFNFAQQVLQNSANLLNSDINTGVTQSVQNLTSSMYDIKSQPQQIFQNVHIAQGVKHETRSPQQTNKGQLQQKPQTSPNHGDQTSDMQSTVPGDKLINDIKNNRDLASAGMGTLDSEEQNRSKKRINNHKTKVARHSSIEAASVVSERGKIGIESDRIKTNSRHSKLSRNSLGNTMGMGAGNILVGEKVLDDGDQDTLLKGIFAPNGIIHQEDQAENNNFNIQIGGPNTNLMSPVISPAHEINTAFASPPLSITMDNVQNQHGKPVDTELMLHLLRSQDGAQAAADMQKIHEAILSFQTQRILDNIKGPFEQDEIDALLQREFGISARSSRRDSSRMDNIENINVKGNELQLKNVKDDKINLTQRQMIIKKLEQTYIKVNSHRRDDFIRDYKNKTAKKTSMTQSSFNHKQKEDQSPPRNNSRNAKGNRSGRIATLGTDRAHITPNSDITSPVGNGAPLKSQIVDSVQVNTQNSDIHPSRDYVNSGVVQAFTLEKNENVVINNSNNDQAHILNIDENIVVPSTNFQKGFCDSPATVNESVKKGERTDMQSIRGLLTQIGGDQNLQTQSSNQDQHLNPREFPNRIAEVQKQMFDDYLSYFTDFKKAERIKALLGSSKGGDRLFEDLSKLFIDDMAQFTKHKSQTTDEKAGNTKYIRFKEKHFYILMDSLYLNQASLAQKGLDVDLYYKQKQKASQDKYIDHVKKKLQNKITEIETENRVKQKQLVKDGGLFPDDLLPANNPKCKEQGDEKNKDESTQDDNEALTQKQKEQIKREQNEKKYEKLLIEREIKVNDALSSNRSKYGSRLDVDTLTKEIYEDEEINKGINEINQQDQVEQKNDQNLSLKAQGEALNNLKNGFEMSVQKLAKVSAYDNDSILSTNRSQFGMPGNMKNSFGSKKQSGKYFNQRSKSNAPMIQNKNSFIKMNQSRDIDENAEISIENQNLTSQSKTFGGGEFEDDSQSQGLIERQGKLRFQHVLNFEAKSKLSRGDTCNHENNQRLQFMRQTFKENVKFMQNRGTRNEEILGSTHNDLKRDQTFGGNTDLSSAMAIRDGKIAYTLPSARDAARFHNKSVSLAQDGPNLSINAHAQQETSVQQATPSHKSQANDYAESKKLNKKQQKKVPDLKGNTISNFRNVSLGKQNDQRQFSKTGYGTHRSRMHTNDNQWSIQRTLEQDIDNSRKLGLRANLKPIPPKTQENATKYQTMQCNTGNNSPRSKIFVRKENQDVFIKQGTASKGSHISDISKALGHNSLFSSKRQTLQGLSTSQNNDEVPSLKIGRYKKLPEKVEEQEFMAYISNQRAVLPALKDIIDKQIDEHNDGGDDEDGLLSQSKQDRNQFQYELLMERSKREKNTNTKVAGGLSDPRLFSIENESKGISTASGVRKNQIFNNNSLMHGVGVSKKSKMEAQSILNKRKASVPLSQTAKLNMFKIKQNMLAELSAVEAQVTQTINKAPQPLDLFKIPHAYKHLEHNLILQNMAKIGGEDQQNQGFMVNPQSLNQKINYRNAHQAPQHEKSNPVVLSQSEEDTLNPKNEGTIDSKLVSQKNISQHDSQKLDLVPQGKDNLKMVTVSNYDDATDINSRLYNETQNSARSQTAVMRSSSVVQSQISQAKQTNPHRQSLIDTIVAQAGNNGKNEDSQSNEGHYGFNNLALNPQQYLNAPDVAINHLNELQNFKTQQLPKKYQLPKLPNNLGQTQKTDKNNLKLRVTDHLIKFEPIQAKEFITKKPVIRNFKEESTRILGEQFNPKLLKKQEAEMKKLANQEEQEVQQFFLKNIEALDF